MKKRLAVVSGIIVIAIIVALAVVGGNTAAKTVSVAEAASGAYADKKIQVSGNVVTDSFEMQGNVLTFSIYDPAADPGTHVVVRYDGAASSTFGNDVTAICTGKMTSAGELICSELVTKCPSKYEDSASALGVSRLLEYGESVVDKPVKVTGTVKSGTLVAAGAAERFVIVDADGQGELSVAFDGALSEEVVEGSAVVLTGSLSPQGSFAATDVALEG